MHTLHDFMTAVNMELSWLNEKEEIEANRDWADKNLNLREVEKYFEGLMSELETRETHFSSVQVTAIGLIKSLYAQKRERGSFPHAKTAMYKV